MHEVFCSRKV
jgi:hypothetical protein